MTIFRTVRRAAGVRPPSRSPPSMSTKAVDAWWCSSTDRSLSGWPHLRGGSKVSLTAQQETSCSHAHVNASLLLVLTSKLLVVPLCSRSWQRHARSSASASRSV